MILTLKSRSLHSVWIAEPYTLMIDPLEIVHAELKGILLKRIATYAPGKVDANTSDKMVEIAKRIKKIALSIVEKIIMIRMQNGVLLF